MNDFSQRIDRRTLIKRLAATATFLGMASSLPALHHAASRGKRMGIVVHSYAFRGSRNQKSKKYPPFQDAIELLEHVHTYGAGGVQTRVSGWSKDFSKRLRRRIEELDMFIEGSISTPKTKSDVERFESEIVNAKEAGATVFRTAMGGRRYEDFDHREGWKQLKKQAWKSLRLAEPIVRKHRVRLAVENHKDWQVADLVEFMKGLSSEYIGVTIDTGNSISLLEHPDETVKGLARYGFTTHIKDMGVQEYQDGFLLSEVPIGQGFLDMERIFKTIEKQNPDIRFNLEMITRDPLKIPCLRKGYWATFEDREANRLANALKWIRSNVQKDLPSVAGKSLDEKIEYEELHNHLSVQYAKERLGLKG
ncbi:MAG: sugar phosphate isomerase/epimerase [Verrucomicrobia bacterium]|nr:sugar phosphate isomerase/epimerase [Verrucomicrobiota bacterium]